MDAAESNQFSSALHAQEERLTCQEEQVVMLSRGVQGLAHSQEDFKAAIATQVSQLTEQMQQFLSHQQKPDSAPTAPQPQPAPTVPVSPISYAGSGARLAPPDFFSGDPGQCKFFLS